VTPAAIPHVSGLFIYPLKSARGVALPAVELDTIGPRADRRWMLVGPDARFLSQREHPRIALVSVTLREGGLVVEAPDAAPLELCTPRGKGARIRATIWDDTCDVATVDAAADRWFSDVLGTTCRVVYLPDDVERLIDRGYSRDPRRVGLADGFPLLLIGEASLAVLNDKLACPVSMDRFRPNVVVSGAAPYEEDQWRDITIGDLAFTVIKPCDRCATVLVDQATGVRGKEPLATLATYRKWDGKVWFGQNVIHAGPGVIRVGDPVTIYSHDTR
jgi:uncharacterized protein YcbX